MIKAKLIGQWKDVGQILQYRDRLTRALDYAVQQEAQQARRAIVKGMTAQSPGGKPFLPLAELTLASRRFRRFRGTKALIVSASLRNSVTVKRVGIGKAFVGVLRSARSDSGKDLYNIARVQEQGQVIIIRVTKRMRRWFFSLLKSQKRRLKGFRPHIKSTARRAASMWVVRVPPRPFIKPVIDDIISNPVLLQKRMARRVAYRMRLVLGKP